MDIKAKVILSVIVAIFVVHSLSLNFTQDNVFISYRYVKNFINGQGLVFNPGERVEGYTNFLWIILLSIFAKFGLDIEVVSKILGICSGCVALFLLYKISALLFQTNNRWANSAKGKNQMVHTKGTMNLLQGWFFPFFPSLLLASNILKEKNILKKPSRWTIIVWMHIFSYQRFTKIGIWVWRHNRRKKKSVNIAQAFSVLRDVRKKVLTSLAGNIYYFWNEFCEAGIAQLARASPCQGEGRGFEPRFPLF